MLVPSSWIVLHDYVQSESASSRNDYVSLEEFTNWAIMSGVPQDEVSRCIDFLCNVGLIMHFDDAGKSDFGSDGSVRDLVILHPQWLADVMACMVTFRHRWVKHGLLRAGDVQCVFEAYPREMHNKLLGLLQAFNIVYRLPPDGIHGDAVLV